MGERRTPRLTTAARTNALLRDPDHSRGCDQRRVDGVGRGFALTRIGGSGAALVLCCLAHEQRPRLSERDALFMRGLAATIIAALLPTVER